MALATSGTVGLTTLNVDRLIAMAIRKCRLQTAHIEQEVGLSAIDNLFVYLCSLANKGVTLWTIKKMLLGIYPYQNYIDLPVGTIDVRNVLYRTMTFQSDGGTTSSAGGTASYATDQDVDTICTQTSANGNISYEFETPVVVTTIGLMPYGDQVYSLVYEASDDGVTWTTLLTGEADTAIADKKWLWVDLSATGSYQYWRVRETGDGTLNVREVSFCQSPTELPMSRLNQDDYTNLPNKTFQSGSNLNALLQFFMDRQIPQPRFWLWPVPASTFALVSAWGWKQIQDVGRLTDELSIPDRWLDTIVYQLGVRLAEESPEVPLQHVQWLQAKADKAESIAWGEERDKSPIRIAPNIGPYTR